MSFNQYQPDINTMQEYLKQNQENGERNGPTWWSIPSGMSVIRILPPWDPSGRVALPVYMHPIEYKDEGMSYTKYNWTCVNKTFNKPCPICEGLNEIRNSGFDTEEWEATKRQFYINAIVIHDPTYNQKDKGVAPGTHVLMRIPKTLYDWIITQITNPMVGNITDIKTGIDVYVTKEGKGLGTTYNMTLSPNGRTEIPAEYLDKIDSLYNLDEIFSSGFDKEQIDKLISSLKKSVGFINKVVPGVVNEMAGYQQATVVQNNFNPAPSVNPNPVTSTPPWQSGFTEGTIPSPSMSPFSTPVPPVAPNNTSEGAKSNLPKCFGNYDAGNVNCVVCPHELDCSKAKNG